MDSQQRIKELETQIGELKVWSEKNKLTYEANLKRMGDFYDKSISTVNEKFQLLATKAEEAISCSRKVELVFDEQLETVTSMLEEANQTIKELNDEIEELRYELSNSETEV